MMLKKKLSNISIAAWNINGEKPDGTPSEQGVSVGAYKAGEEHTARAIFNISEKDGETEAVVYADELKDRGIPLYISIGDRRLLIRP